jgi:HK97 family phage major capsid protein
MPMPGRYQHLLDERAALVREGQALFAAVEADAQDAQNGHARDLTDDERRRDDAIQARLEALAGEIEREERQRERLRLEPALPAAVAGGPAPPSPAPAATGFGAAGAAVALLHERRLDDPRRGFATLAQFALAVKGALLPGGPVDDRLRGLGTGYGQPGQYGAAPANFHLESATPDGYMVPPDFRDGIWELVAADEDNLLAQVGPEMTSSNVVELLKDESTPWGATGIQARWRAEGTQMTPSRLDTDLVQVPLHPLYAFVLATEELLQDAPRLNDRLSRGAARAIAWKTSDAIMWGTGAGQPLGWMTSGALISVAKESSQTTATVIAANVANMLGRLLAGSLGRAVWKINPDVLPQLVQLTLGDQPIWTPPATGFAGAPGGFLFGRPVQPSEHCQTLGAAGDIQLVDPTGYYATRRTDSPQFASSIHLYFDYNIDAFRWTFRLGGQPYLSAAVSPAHGGNTKSHFVALAVRP